MSSPQKKAVQRHRKRQLEKGNVRMELNVPQKDRELLGSLAGVLRDDGAEADRVRSLVKAALEGEELINFKKFLEMAPLEGVDLTRSKDTGIREIGF